MLHIEDQWNRQAEILEALHRLGPRVSTGIGVDNLSLPNECLFVCLFVDRREFNVTVVVL